MEAYEKCCLDTNAVRCVKNHENILIWDKLYAKMPLYLTLYADSERLNTPIEKVDQDVNTVNICNEVPVSKSIFVVNHLKDKNSLLTAKNYQPLFRIKSKSDFIENIKPVECIMTKLFKTNRNPKIRKHKKLELVVYVILILKTIIRKMDIIVN